MGAREPGKRARDGAGGPSKQDAIAFAAPASMTGHGAATAPLAGGSLSVEVRTVNHRHADVRVKAHAELGDYATAIEARVRPRLARGRAEVHARWEAPSAASGNLDVTRARAAFEVLAKLRDELAPGQELPLAALSSMPGLFSAQVELPKEEVLATLDGVCTQACDALDAMRAREGEALVRDLGERLSLLRTHVDWVEPRREQIVEAIATRLRARIAKLLEGTGAAPDSGRLEQEIALLADRSDVAEEITRLRSHFDQFEALLTSEGQAVGRRMDFLIQEMGREVNTIGSKANDAELSHRVVEMKSELERLREQVQNVL